MPNIDDIVTLRRDFPPGRRGDQGVVIFVDSRGNLTVRLTHDPNCNPKNIQLPPAPADYFESGGGC